LALHRFLRTWTRMVDRYFTPTGFARRKHVEGGFPAEAIRVKPNFVHPDPGPGDGSGAYAMFAGRLSSEKGLDTLLAAWTRLDGLLPLKIIGDGPMAGKIRTAAERHEAIQWLGRRSRDDVLTVARRAAFLVFPSIGLETFGRVIIEAFATGTPVVASRRGAIAELIDDRRTGLLFQPGDADDLALKVRELMDHPSRLARMRKAARQEYEQKYTAQDNYRMLMEIYEEARAERSRRSDRRGAERRADTRKIRHSTRARDKGDTR
jgi:glycosyltransferase involved in cell wall biosynthesis